MVHSAASTTELVLGSESIDVEVIVDKDSITSIRMVNLSDWVFFCLQGGAGSLSGIRVCPGFIQ